MRTLLAFTAGAALTVLPAALFAQDVVISPEVDTYVMAQPAPTIQTPVFSLSLGAPVPATVHVVEVPNSDYGYVVVNKKRVLVDRKSHKVVKIYE